MLGVEDGLHYVAKYICGKKFNNYSQREDGTIELYGVENLEKEMERYMKDYGLYLLKKIMEIESNKTKGITNGTR
jgi:hypothetical protein